MVNLVGGEEAVAIPPGRFRPQHTGGRVSLYVIWTLGANGGQEVDEVYLESGEPDRDSHILCIFKKFEKQCHIHLRYYEDISWVGEEEEDGSFNVSIVDHDY